MRKLFVILALLFVPFMVKAEENSPVKQSIVIFETNKGNIEITLKTDVAPKTCENFLGLVAKH